jgi:hypothetical protein
LEIDEADSHIPTATTMTRMNLILKTRPVKRYAFCGQGHFAEEVARISDHNSPQGWLARFGSYRDCFTHSAPLELVCGFAFAVQDLLFLKNASSIPQIYYPLPEDPEGLRRNRASGFLFDPTNDINAARPRTHNRAKEPDALEYLHGCLCQLTELATRLISRSPIAPEPLVLTKEDIIGEIKIING